jgi:hypothetical protein
MYIYANSSVTKHFPIPESFWPAQYHKDNGHFSRFPARTAHPVFYVSTRDEIHRIFEGFPCDRLSIETSALLSQLVKCPKGTCWSLFVKNSTPKNNMGYPFGFFRVSNTGNAVNLYLLPYNFPKLFKILHKLANLKDQALPSALMMQLTDYLREIPAYYIQPVLKALDSIGMERISQAVPLDPISSHLAQHFKRVAQQATITFIQLQNGIIAQEKQNPKKMIENIYDVPVNKLEQQIRLVMSKGTNRNPNLRSFLTQEELDDLHSLPISEMGNYLPVMHDKPLLRNPYEEEEERRERERGLFGNPYRKLKKTASISKSDQDSAMESLNEMEEEGSHEFKDQISNDTTSRKRSMVLSKQAARQRIPPLSRQTVLILPNFKEIRWASIDGFDFTANLKKMQDQHIEDIVMELDETPKDEIFEATLMVESESEPMTPVSIQEVFEDRILSAAMEVSNSPTEEYTKEWPEVRKFIYQMLSCVPRGKFD